MKKKHYILSTLALTLLLGACTPQKEEIKENPQTIQAFDTYLEELFEESVEEDFLTYHILLVNPQEKGIEKPDVDLGSIDEVDVDDAKEELEELHQFNMNELTQEQRNIYKTIEMNLNHTIEGEQYENYEFVFGNNKINDNLVTNFTEYRITTQEDVEDYILLLNDTQRFLNEGIERTKKQADEGFIQNETIKKDVIKQCSKFLESQEIQKYFNQQIEHLDYSSSQKEKYKNQVHDAVENVMKVAYKDIVELYQKLPTSEYQGSLAEMKNGKEYYEWLLKGKLGSNKSANDWGVIGEKELQELITEIILIMYTDTPDSQLSELKAPTEDIQEMVEYLEGMVSNEFPEIEKVNYTVSLLDESVVDELTVAYYVIPPVDASDLNTIKVNPAYQKNMVELMSTLAHEGFPGHLYQNNYLVQNSSYDIYALLSNLGYSEGWANYVGSDVYRLCNLGSETVQKYLMLNEYFGYMVYGYYDIMINYHGWDMDKIRLSLNDFGLVPELADELYDTLVSNPALYAPYSFGMYEVLSLREKAENVLKDKFDVKQFHKAFLDVGPLSFEVVEEAIQRYIEAFE